MVRDPFLALGRLLQGKSEDEDQVWGSDAEDSDKSDDEDNTSSED